MGINLHFFKCLSQKVVVAIHLSLNELMPAVAKWNDRATCLSFSTRREQTPHFLSVIMILLIPALGV